ncbi:MAG: hypothetical protein IT532_17085 [Burkholderiales bacterium]|nr:hypothetical protein [Burkholderiales bacterium]
MTAQGVIRDVDSFYQWVVELWKPLATQTIPAFVYRTEAQPTHGNSTNASIRRYRRPRQW